MIIQVRGGRHTGRVQADHCVSSRQARAFNVLLLHVCNVQYASCSMNKGSGHSQARRCMPAMHMCECDDRHHKAAAIDLP